MDEILGYFTNDFAIRSFYKISNLKMNFWPTREAQIKKFQNDSFQFQNDNFQFQNDSLQSFLLSINA